MDEAIARLNGPAARLLLVILLARARGETRLRAGEMKRRAGIEASRYWEAAISDLERAGLATIRKVPHSHEYEFVTNLTVFNGSVRESVKSDSGPSIFIDRYTSDAKAADRDAALGLMSDLSEIFGSKVPKQEFGSIVPNIGEPVQNLGQKSQIPGKYGSIVPKEDLGQKDQIPEYGSIVPNLRQECVQVDRMDDSGDLKLTSSPAQARRRQQIVVVQKVWAEFFPTQNALVAENAKWFLSRCDQSAEGVYDLLEYVKSRGVESPLGYARRTAENRMRENQPQAPVSPAPMLRLVEPEPEEISEDEWQRRERVVERQQAERIRKLMERNGNATGTQNF